MAKRIAQKNITKQKPYKLRGCRNNTTQKKCVTKITLAIVSKLYRLSDFNLLSQSLIRST